MAAKLVVALAVTLAVGLVFVLAKRYRDGGEDIDLSAPYPGPHERRPPSNRMD